MINTPQISVQHYDYPMHVQRLSGYDMPRCGLQKSNKTPQTFELRYPYYMTRETAAELLAVARRRNAERRAAKTIRGLLQTLQSEVAPFYRGA
jgi:hypothetical protein